MILPTLLQDIMFFCEKAWPELDLKNWIHIKCGMTEEHE
jgi:hypothetical protein